METKKCSHCGNVLPLSKFCKNSKSDDGHSRTCKTCSSLIQKKSRLKKMGKLLPPMLNPALEVFTPQELIDHLKALGYTGELRFVETKTHIIKV